MSSFTLVINSGPDSQGAYSGWRFAQSLLKQGHRLNQVFFYQQGIHNGNALLSPPGDEINILHCWQQLQHAHQLELICCVAAAMRRGVLDKETANEQQLHAPNLAEGFRLGGLGELVTAMATTDRVIQF